MPAPCLDCGQDYVAIPGKGSGRGCCRYCRGEQRRAIRRGAVTEEELVAQGRLGPVKKSCWTDYLFLRR